MNHTLTTLSGKVVHYDDSLDYAAEVLAQVNPHTHNKDSLVRNMIDTISTLVDSGYTYGGTLGFIMTIFTGVNKDLVARCSVHPLTMKQFLESHNIRNKRTFKRHAA